MSEEKKELTPEQIEANRIRVLNYYRTQAEVLTAQCEYEKLLAEIETHRAKRMEMIIRQAQMSAGPEDEPTNETTDPSNREPESEDSLRDQVAPQEQAPEEKKERKLKSK